MWPTLASPTDIEVPGSARLGTRWLAARLSSPCGSHGGPHYPVDVKTGSNGDLFYVDIYGGAIGEISYAA